MKNNTISAVEVFSWDVPDWNTGGMKSQGCDTSVEFNGQNCGI